jgi:uncharacterized membrane protein
VEVTSVPRGRRNGQDGSALATALGVFSLGLGTAQVLSPDGVSRLAGVRGSSPTVQAVQRVVGARELVQGTGILASSSPRGWVWSRVAGDVVDVGMLVAAARAHGHDRTRLAIALGALVGVGVADLVAALQLSRDGLSRDGDDTGGALSATAAITVNRSADEVYRRWRDIEGLPAFMAHLRSVRADSATRSHWEAEGPVGTVQWDAEIVDDRPGELLAWRSVDGADVDNDGTVRFRPAAGGRGTEIRVDLRYRPPGGRAGRIVAKLLGEEPDQQLRDDLRRFKQIVEIGEIVRSEGSPSGQSTRQQVAQRPAQPVR